jgi:hypothetical protein
MWIGVKDASTGVPIANAWFSHGNYRYPNGWYWVLISPYQSGQCGASGYNTASFYTNGWDSLNVYLTRPISSGGGGW